jgi:hypothetical protein
VTWLDTSIIGESQKLIQLASNWVDLSFVKTYLKQLDDMIGKCSNSNGWEYPTIYRYFLKNGKTYESAKFTNQELAIVKYELQNHKTLYKKKQCFYNAQQMAQKTECQYAEGFLMSGIFPIAHAWNTLNGKVIDFTMHHANDGKPILGEIPAGWEYFGVDFQTDMIIKLWSETGIAGSIVDNYTQDFPLLKGNKTQDKVETPEFPETLEQPKELEII